MIKHYTKYERARIIGARALQLSMGAPMLLKLKKEDLEKINYSPIDIAKTEYDQGIIPITIRRPLPGRLRE
ncbi:MAG: DNA-directed RNA polymerase subunit K [Candidatus Nanoarchaeia archaeon]|nr:DNA-directed RNA polymerase subunit K [Candidatus Nanoarchaeia archaeon]